MIFDRRLAEHIFKPGFIMFSSFLSQRMSFSLPGCEMLLNFPLNDDVYSASVSFLLCRRRLRRSDRGLSGGGWRGGFEMFPPNQDDCKPCSTKAWISISKEKGECPPHVPPLARLAPRRTVLVTLVTSRGQNADQGFWPLVSPPSLPSPLQFILMMTNTFYSEKGQSPYASDSFALLHF